MPEKQEENQDQEEAKDDQIIEETNEEDEDLVPHASQVVKVDPTPTKTSGFGAKIQEVEESGESPDLSYFAALANED